MSRMIVARWQDWTGTGVEHLVLHETGSMVADAVLLSPSDARLFAARYHIACDESSRVRKAVVEVIGGERRLELEADGSGNWRDSQAGDLPLLTGAIDIDLSASPFTNTLPIRRLGLQAGRSAELRVVYVDFPDLSVAIDRQRYTCLKPGKLYRYQSVDSDFVRTIEVDADGLVVNYPDLFKRIL